MESVNPVLNPFNLINTGDLRNDSFCGWIRLGDGNTSFFHAKMKERRAKMRINILIG